MHIQIIEIPYAYAAEVVEPRRRKPTERVFRAKRPFRAHVRHATFEEAPVALTVAPVHRDEAEVTRYRWFDGKLWTPGGRRATLHRFTEAEVDDTVERLTQRLLLRGRQQFPELAQLPLLEETRVRSVEATGRYDVERELAEIAECALVVDGIVYEPVPEPYLDVRATSRGTIRVTLREVWDNKIPADENTYNLLERDLAIEEWRATVERESPGSPFALLEDAEIEVWIPEAIRHRPREQWAKERVERVRRAFAEALELAGRLNVGVHVAGQTGETPFTLNGLEFAPQAER